MRKFIALLNLSVIFFVLSVSCEDTITDRHTYTANVPIYMSIDDFKTAFKVVEPQELVNPGKIYFKDNFIFINEMNKGVHIYDNSDPSNPQNISFIELPFNVDIAIANNYLYADSHSDLVVIDISDINNPKEINRIDNSFPYYLPPYDRRYSLADIDKSLGVVIGFEIKEIVEENIVTEEELRDRKIYIGSGFGVTAQSGTDGSNGGTNTSTGIAGSMARFMIYDQYLYTLNRSKMILFDISALDQPFKSNEITVNLDIETLFRYEDKMFIGAQTGMHIFDLSSPGNPTYLSVFMHARSCDPVVVENDIAYITLHSGTFCGGNFNRLDIVDISDINNPVMLKSYGLQSPHGLGIDNGTLFICNGEAGLLIFDASDPYSLTYNQIAHFQDINAKDVIPLGSILLMIGDDGLYQYDYSDLNNLKLLSKIGIKQD